MRTKDAAFSPERKRDGERRVPRRCEPRLTERVRLVTACVCRTTRDDVDNARIRWHGGGPRIDQGIAATATVAAVCHPYMRADECRRATATTRVTILARAMRVHLVEGPPRRAFSTSTFPSIDTRVPSCLFSPSLSISPFPYLALTHIHSLSLSLSLIFPYVSRVCHGLDIRSFVFPARDGRELNARWLTSADLRSCA